MRINAGNAPLLRNDEMSSRQNDMLTCQQARTIASWWQTSGTVGSALAELASTGSVDVNNLIADIRATIRESQAELSHDSLCELIALNAWAVHQKYCVDTN